MYSLKAQFRNVSAQYASARQYYLVLRDDQWNPPYKRTGLVKLTGAPCVFRMEPFGFTYLTRGWQEMFFEVNKTHRGFKEDHKDFVTMLESSKSHTNARGLWNLKSEPAKQTARDYIINTGPMLDVKYAALILGGNVICGEETEMPFPSGHIARGEKVLKVETLTKPMMGITYETHPHLIHKGTIILDRLAPDGGWTLNPYPDKDGRLTGLDCFYPVISERTVYYPMKQLRKLPLGKPLPPVYNPP